MSNTTGPSSSPTNRGALVAIANWALLLSGLVNLGIGTAAALDGSAVIASTSLTAGLILLLAATIDRFESLKGLGMEAKTRQLDEKIGQADDALRRLREMTEITGAAIVDLNSKTGRFGTAPGPRESIALADRVRRIMSALGSDAATVAAALRPWAKTLCFDASRAITKQIQPLVRERRLELERERQQLPQPIETNSPEFERINAAIGAIQEYGERIMRFGFVDLEEYPEALMSIFDSFPGNSPAQLSALRDKAVQLAVGMKSLRESRTLTDVELWITTIEHARER